MSSFTALFTEKETGKTYRVDCIDDYFGRHKYGYLPEGETVYLTEKQFEKRFKQDEPHE